MDAPKVIIVAKNFSKYPAGRFLTDGPESGERFRDEVLVPMLRDTSAKLTIDLDGTLGYGSSFLEEAFGGLIRERGFKADDLQKRLVLVSNDPSLITEVWGYISDATPKR